MNERTFCLSTLRLKPGMKLARTVHRPDGAVLVPADTELSESLLEQFQQRGIEAVFVRQVDKRSADEIARDQVATEQRVTFLFRAQSGVDAGAENDEARAELQAVMRAYRCPEQAT